MKDKKTGILGALVLLVGLGVYNLCVFLLVSDYTNVFWASYIFTTIAFIAQIVADLIFGKSGASAKFLSLPLFYIGGIYFAVQLIAGIVCMIAPMSITLALIVQVLILAIYIGITLTATTAKEQIIKTDDNIKNATDFIRALTMEAEHLYLSEEDESKKTELKKLYEAIRYSDPMSSTKEICIIDEQIHAAFRIISDKLSSATADEIKKEIKQILDLIAKRNLLCKSSK